MNHDEELDLELEDCILNVIKNDSQIPISRGPSNAFSGSPTCIQGGDEEGEVGIGTTDLVDPALAVVWWWCSEWWTMRDGREAVQWAVLYSSTSALLGNAGQANYAAANAAMDGRARGAQAAGLPRVSVQWGAWSGGGPFGPRKSSQLTAH